MDPVSNVDRLVLVLRQRLAERDRRAAVSRGQAAERRAPTRTEVLQELAAVDGADDRHLARALIEGILADEFGEQMVNEARFQQVVERVVRTILEDKDAASLLNATLAAVRTGA